MPLEPLPPLFHRLNREHFDGSLVRDGLPLVSLRWSDGRMRRTAGLYRRGLDAQGQLFSEIVLSRPLLEPLPHQALLSTLCHEMIHAWVDRVQRRREAHGPCFRACMARINAAQSEFQVSVRHHYPLPGGAVASPSRWLARCPRCGTTAPYRRRVRGLACRACCERHHGGRWDPSCLLEFLPAVPQNPAASALGRTDAPT